MTSTPWISVPGLVIDADECFQKLRDELEWERRDTTPRCEYYCNDLPFDYAYGRGRGVRSYSPRPWHPTILSIRRRVEEYAQVFFEVCFLNRYLTGRDHLGWHSDNSPEMDDARPIVVVSLGAQRKIWFREIGSKNTHEERVLAHGSMLYMAPGMQDTHEHRIPKSSEQDCGERISLTFRGYVRTA